MQRNGITILLTATLIGGCGTTDRDDEGMFGGGDDGDGGFTGDGSGDDGEGGGGDDGDDSGDDGSDGEGGDDVKYDVDPGEGDGGGDSEAGCDKVDFLFVVDNSGSMADEQANLVAAFPKFIDTIQQTLMAQDYQILVTDTDGFLDGGNCNGSPPSCCDSYCAAQPLKLCAGKTCPGVDPCMGDIGSGRVVSQNGTDCGVAGGRNYIVDGQPDLEGTFSCMALVGTGGDGREVQMQAISEGIGPLNAAGQCNEGFVRDDAVLVITLITDEEDDPNDGGDVDPGSPGGPAQWRDNIVQVKNGDANAVVVLGLVGDTDVPGGVCAPLANGVGAEPAPRLREFVELFGDRGIWASVCSADYSPFFEEAVGHIDSACDDFVPPG